MRLIDIEDDTLLKNVYAGGLSAKALWRLIKQQPTFDKGECITCKRGSYYPRMLGEEKTRCPIEEHYALPNDGHCHLYETEEV